MFGFLRRRKPDATPSPADAQADAQADSLADSLADSVADSVANSPAESHSESTAPVVEQNIGLPPTAKPSNIPLPDSQKTPRKSWLTRLKAGLGKTRRNLGGLFIGAKIDDDLYEELETALLTCDAGISATEYLLTQLRQQVKENKLESGEDVRLALHAILRDLLVPMEAPLDIDQAQPLIMMLCGVNGAGKTTSIGKLAHHLKAEGKSILLAAGDTFRAAAREQLEQWGQRNDVQVLAQKGGDPAAVSFDAVTAGKARHTGVVMIDTAGRLPTQAHLMKELQKIRRVVAKAMDDAPHEVLLVLDGNTGQNMLAQVQAFDEAVQLTGLIITKLDGTAKGGALAALAYLRRDNPIPVYFIGIGEAVDDLQGFSASEFASALLDQ